MVIAQTRHFQPGAIVLPCSQHSDSLATPLHFESNGIMLVVDVIRPSDKALNFTATNSPLDPQANSITVVTCTEESASELSIPKL